MSPSPLFELAGVDATMFFQKPMTGSNPNIESRVGGYTAQGIPPLDLSQDWTIVADANSTMLPGEGSLQTVLGLSPWGGGPQLLMAIYRDLQKNGIYAAGVQTASGDMTVVEQRPKDAEGQTNKWCLVTIVKKGNSLELFVNGELEDARDLHNVASVSTKCCQLIIGARYDTVGIRDQFSGYIAGVQVYASALPPADIKTLFDGERAKKARTAPSI